MASTGRNVPACLAAELIADAELDPVEARHTAGSWLSLDLPLGMVPIGSLPAATVSPGSLAAVVEGCKVVVDQHTGHAVAGDIPVAFACAVRVLGHSALQLGTLRPAGVRVDLEKDTEAAAFVVEHGMAQYHFESKVIVLAFSFQVAKVAFDAGKRATGVPALHSATLHGTWPEGRTAVDMVTDDQLREILGMLSREGEEVEEDEETAHGAICPC